MQGKWYTVWTNLCVYSWLVSVFIDQEPQQADSDKQGFSTVENGVSKKGSRNKVILSTIAIDLLSLPDSYMQHFTCLTI